jgi:hypothetical protein
MKKIVLIIFLVMAQQAAAQQQTLFSSTEITNGGFGGPVLKYTSINSNGALLVGGRGGWIINHTFVLGGGLYGLATYVPADVIEEDIIREDADNLYLMYGGLELEYLFSPMKVVHYSFEMLIGMGGLGYWGVLKNLNENNMDQITKLYFVAEPAFNLELNVTTFFHLDIGVSYRYTNGANYQAITDDDLCGFNGMLTFKFGKF